MRVRFSCTFLREISTDTLCVAAARRQYNSPMEEAIYPNGLGVFFGVRPRLFDITYRMLGSAFEADGLLCFSRCISSD